MSFKKILAVAYVFLALGSAAASAHGDLGSTTPAADSKLNKAPDHLIINFTEPPTKNSVVKVKDGCGDEITDSVSFSDRVAHVFTDEGQPGKWKVSYEVVSAADGHKSDGGYGFTITGEKDCSPGEKEPKNNDSNNGGGSGPGPQANDGGGGDDGSSFPVVPVVIGGAGVIALALVARRLAG